MTELPTYLGSGLADAVPGISHTTDGGKVGSVQQIEDRSSDLACQLQAQARMAAWYQACMTGLKAQVQALEVTAAGSRAAERSKELDLSCFRLKSERKEAGLLAALEQEARWRVAGVQERRALAARVQELEGRVQDLRTHGGQLQASLGKKSEALVRMQRLLGGLAKEGYVPAAT